MPSDVNSNPAAPTSANAGEIERWNREGGQAWADLADRIDPMVEPLGAAAMDALDPPRSARVIDIGCGCGATSLALFARVGPGGAVAGVDISAPMLAVARARAAGPGAGRVFFVQADAQTHRFPPGEADAVFSRFGVMFFDDPAGAFANIARAARPGGRLGFVCWRAMALNPMMRLGMEAALPLLPAPPPPPDPLAPGPFAFADADRVRSLLTEAGWADIDIAAHDAPTSAGDLEATTETNLRIGPLGTLVRENPPLGERVRDAVREAFRPHLRDGRVVLETATWIVTARKP